jgi:hypothetical protein
MYFFKHNQQGATLYSILHYCQCSTCFKRFLHPSSGAQKLYTQHPVYVKLAVWSVWTEWPAFSPVGRISTSKHPKVSQKTVVINLLDEGTVLPALLGGISWCHSLLCHFVLVSEWWNQLSLPFTVFSRKSSSLRCVLQETEATLLCALLCFCVCVCFVLFCFVSKQGYIFCCPDVTSSYSTSTLKWKNGFTGSMRCYPKVPETLRLWCNHLPNFCLPPFPSK